MSNMSKKLQTILMLFIFGITVALATVTGVYALSSINFGTSGGIQFGQDTYPLVLELNGGQVKGQTLTSYTYSDTVAFSLPDGNAYASKTGYTFDSWCSDEALTTKVTSIPAKTRGTKTYYAKWNANEYTLTFDANGGSVSPTSKQVTYDQAVGTLPTPTRGGYTFDAWYNSATGGTKYTSSTIYKVADDLTLHARWNSITYNITIEPNGGTIGSHDTTYKTGTSQTKTIPNPTRNGYTFTGWTVSWTDSSNHASDSLKPTISGTSTSLSIPTDCYGNITLTANWKVVEYTITYHLNSGSWKSGFKPTTKYTIESSTITLPTASNIEKVGYTFAGWYEDPSFSGSAIKNILAGSTGNKTYYARWTANSGTAYTVNHYQEKIGIASPSEAKPTDWTLADTDNLTGTTGASVTPSVKSYTGFTAPSTRTVTIAADGSTVVNYYYTRNSYKLTLSEGTGIASVSGAGTYDYEEDVLASATASTGYTFSGWTSNNTGLLPNSNNASYTFNMPAGAVTLTANATANKITVTFDYQNATGGNTTSTMQVTFNSTYGTLPSPTKTGYTFAGWFTSTSWTTQVTNSTKVTNASNHTLYARWTANTNTAYKVNHYQEIIGIDSPSESTSSHWTLKETQNLTGTTGASVTPSVKSYTGFTAPSTKTVTINADGSTVVNYYYTRNSYTLTLNKGTGISTVSGAGTYDYEEEVTATATASTGYTFSNWTSNNTGLLPNSNNVSYTFNMPAGAVTLTANATANKITVTFDYQGATGGNTEKSRQVTFNSTYGTLPNPTKTGYTFAGWYTSTSWTTKVTNSTKVTNASNHTLYARWTANTNTAYKVNHYQENIDVATPSESTSSHWTLKETQNLTGTTASSVTPSVKSYTGFTSPSTKTVTIAANGSTVVNYYYTRNTYKLTLSEGTGIASVLGAGTYDYGKSITASATVSTGYTFSGWTSSSITLLPNSSKVSYTFNMPAGAVKLTANATANGYVVTYNATENGGTFTSGGTGYTSTASVKYGAAVDLSTTNRKGTKDGWTFVGWNTSSTATSALTSYTMPAKNVTLYAIYSKTITASFYQLNSTNAETKSTTIYNKATTGSLTAPALSTQSGLTIVGWGTATNSTTSSVGSGASVSLSNSTTYYAVYKYTISVSYNGNRNTSGSTSGTSGTAYKTANKTASPTVKGITISLATNGFSRTGYKFSKWAEGSTSGEQYTAGTERTLTASTTYYAIWTPINVTISASKTSETLTYGYSTTNIATITASGGGGRWTYSLVESTSSYFALSTTSATTSSVTLKFNAGAKAGTYTVKVKATSTYNSQSATTEEITVTVNKRALTITADSASKVYDGTPLTKNTFTSSGLLSGHTISSCTVTGTITNVGTVNNVPSNATVMSGSTNVTSNYQISYKNGTLTVTKANGYITINPTSSTITYGTSSKTFTVTSNHGGTLTVSDNNATAQASISGTTVTVSNLGSISAGTTIKITVTCSATQNYNSASAVHTLTIEKANISPTVSMNDYEYGGTKSNPSITVNPGDGSVTYYYNTTNSNSGGKPWTNVTSSKYLDVGTYYMYAVVAATTNYNGATTPAVSFTISKGTVTAPTTLSVNKDGIVTWDNVANATGYQISINGSTWTSASSGVNYLSTIIATTGTRTIYVRAINSDSTNYATPSSNKSTSVVVYTLTINSNNTSYGTVSSSSIKVISGSTYTTSSNVLTVTRQSKTEKVTATPTTSTSQYTYSFSSWSSTSGTISANTTVTANFTRTGVAYTITYNANGGTGANQTENVPYQTTFTTKPSDTFTRSGYTFVGWSTSTSAWEGNYKYANTSYTYTNTTNITLYAIWRQNVSYLNKNWKRLINDVKGTSFTSTITQINYTNSTSGLSGTQIQVGTTSVTSTTVWSQSNTSCYGLTAYINQTVVTFYAPYKIYAPQDSSSLFALLNNVYSLGTLISNLDTSYVTDMTFMFYGNYKLETINFDLNFDTSKVKNMYGMFERSAFSELDLSSFSTDNVENMTRMFSDDTELKNITFGSNFKTNNVKRMDEMFNNCRSLLSIDLSSFDTSKVTNMAGVFYGCRQITSLNLANFDTSNVKVMNSMFDGCTSLQNLALFTSSTSNVTNMNMLFRNCENLTTLDLSNFNTSIVTGMSGMFMGCTSLRSITFGSSFVTDNVTNMSAMFSSCRALTNIDLTDFNTSKVRNMSGMFNECMNLTTLNLTNFNTTKVTDMSGMFSGCSKLTSIRFGANFLTTNVRDMTKMFALCRKLSALDIRFFTIQTNTTVSSMLSDCDSLIEIKTPYTIASGVTIALPSGSFYDLTNNLGPYTTITNTNDGGVTLTKINGEARIGTTYYSTLESAVSAALSGQTVEIIAQNIEVTSTMDIAKDLTIVAQNASTITRSAGSFAIFNITSGDVKIGTSGKMIIFDGSNTMHGTKLTKTAINITRTTSKISNLTLGSYVTFQNFYLQTSNGAVINSTGYTTGARNYKVSITISGAQFLSNRASNQGAQGAVIYPAYTDITISSGTFNGNYTTATSNSYAYGGVVYLPSNTSLTVEGGTFTNNYADKGGVFYVAGGTLSISNGSFSGNGKKPDQPYSTTYGDIIYLSSGTATISGGTLNTPGNAIYVAGTAASMLKISGGTIQTQTDNDYAINLNYGRNLQISGSPTIVGKGSDGAGNYFVGIFVRNNMGSKAYAIVLGDDYDPTELVRITFNDNLTNDTDYIFSGTHTLKSSNIYVGGYGYNMNDYLSKKTDGYVFSSCFTTDTYIIIWDDKKKKLRRKKAKKLTYKDKLLVWNFDKGCFDFANPLWIQKEEVADKYTLITFSDGSKLKVVGDHAVFNYDKQFFCPICSNESWGCPIGTRVVKYDGSIVTIVSKKVINKKVEYTNILTKYHMNVYASGILTSTPFNNMYKVENMKYVKDEVKECKNLTLLEGISQEWIEGMRLKEYPDHILIAGIKHFANCKTFKDYIDMKIKEQKFD